MSEIGDVLEALATAARRVAGLTVERGVLRGEGEPRSPFLAIAEPVESISRQDHGQRVVTFTATGELQVLSKPGTDPPQRPELEDVLTLLDQIRDEIERDPKLGSVAARDAWVSARAAREDPRETIRLGDLTFTVELVRFSGYRAGHVA